MKLLTAPTAEPVTLDQAKFAARLTGISAFDAMIPLYIQAAREIAEMETGVRWMAQEWRAELSNWPAADAQINLAGPTAVAVSYWSKAGAWETLAPADMTWVDNDPGVAILPAYGKTFPELGDVSGGPRVRVDVTVGAADADQVPAAIKVFIMANVAYWIDNPKAYTDKPHTAAPTTITMLETQRVAF